MVGRDWVGRDGDWSDAGGGKFWLVEMGWGATVIDWPDACGGELWFVEVGRWVAVIGRVLYR